MIDCLIYGGSRDGSRDGSRVLGLPGGGYETACCVYHLLSGVNCRGLFG